MSAPRSPYDVQTVRVRPKTPREERDELAKLIYASMVGGQYRGEEGSKANAEDSFRLADQWVAERDRRAKSDPFPSPSDAVRGPQHLIRTAEIHDARARCSDATAAGLDASGSIKLGEGQRFGPFTNRVWAIFSTVDGRPLTSSPGMPLTFTTRQRAVDAVREMGTAWIAVEAELTLDPVR